MKELLGVKKICGTIEIIQLARKMFEIRTSRPACAGEARRESDREDGTSTQTGGTSQTLLLCRNRRGLRRRMVDIRPKRVEKEVPILLLNEKDRIRMRKFIHEVFQESKLPNRFDDFSRCDSATIVRGSLLGKGTFSSVHAVRSGTLSKKFRGRKATVGTMKKSSKFESHRVGTIEMTFHKNPWLSRLGKIYERLSFGGWKQKYAVKTINEDAPSTEMLVWSIAYLVAETRILSGLDHPHIIRFCGWGSSSRHSSMFERGENKEDEVSRIQYGHFLVIERLEVILKKQLKEWELERRKIAGHFMAGKMYPDEAKIVGATSVNHKYRRIRQIDYLNRMYIYRLRVAVQVASAVMYLHERNILHRDIKPQNIGFDKSGNVKLFDFGIAKEIAFATSTTTSTGTTNTNAGDEVNDRLHNITGLAGSRSYMSPENGLRQPYNAKADVYSFSMVLWELMTLHKLPHRRYSNSKLEEKVWLGPDHERPPLIAFVDGNISDKVVSENKCLLELPVSNLLERCWSPIVHDRPTMKTVHDVLRKHSLQVRNFACSKVCQHQGV